MAFKQCRVCGQAHSIMQHGVRLIREVELRPSEVWRRYNREIRDRVKGHVRREVRRGVG